MPLGLEAWNGDMPILRMRFLYGRVSPTAPLRFSPNGLWLFVEDAGLRKLEQFVAPELAGSVPVEAAETPTSVSKIDFARAHFAEAVRSLRPKSGQQYPSFRETCRRLADLWFREMEAREPTEKERASLAAGYKTQLGRKAISDADVQHVWDGGEIAHH